MQIDLSAHGLRLIGPGGRVELGPAMPAVTVSIGGRERRWVPRHLELHADEGVLRATGGPGGVELELTARHVEEAPHRDAPGSADTSADPSADRIGLVDDSADVEVTVRLLNPGRTPVPVERLSVLHTERVQVGEDPRRWRTYRNGYQSWAGTRTMAVDESDADLPTRLVRLSGTDAKHAAPTDVGHVRSDAVSVVCEPVSGDALGIGFLDLGDAFGFVELVAPHGTVQRLDTWCDLDGTALAPGASVTARVRVTAASGARAGSVALESLLAAAGRTMAARATDQHHPGGWCSWYYYFAKVTEADVHENLEVLAADGRDGPVYSCEYVMVDDGHQSQIGDWLLTSPDKFPSGMADLSRRIRDAGFDAGIWWAPFLVHPNSRTAQEHPDWLVRNGRGRPIVGILNPVWSVRTPMRVLDTTHPQVLEHLRRIAAVIGHEWGYAIQKLDFLYAAALPGVRFEPGATRAASLRMGLDAIREGAGEDGFLLGCGCPLGPALGVVDAMRIGADVTPYWSNVIDRVGGRGRHGLATRNAVVNVMTRSAFDRRWWLNDPDCLMVRDTDTKLTEDEVRLLATVMGMTDGMLVISDRLTRLGEQRRDLISRTRELAGGSVEVPDLFEAAIPEILVSRHGSHVDVAVLNMGEHRRRSRVDLLRRGVRAEDGELQEFWTGEAVRVAGGIADFGELGPHSARVVRLPG